MAIAAARVCAAVRAMDAAAPELEVEAGPPESSQMLALMPPPPDEDICAHGSACGGGASPELALSVHVRVADGVCEPMLKRGAALPARATRLFTTTQDSQATAHVELYVGERPFCHGNLFLGLMVLSPLATPSYRSFVQLEVTIEASANGVITAEAAEVERRALEEPFCEASLLAALLGAGGPPPDRGREGREIAVFSHALAKHLPVLLATRTVRLPCGKDVVIRQHQRREEEQIGTGGVLWEAAIVLADFVSRHSAKYQWQGKRVLELGAGTGLVAIALAAEGADVLATDGNPRVCEGARRNIDGAGELRGRVAVETFDWNSASDLERVRNAGPWDAVVGSDLVYPGNAGRRCVASNACKHPADETLLALFEALAGPGTKVIIALKDRTGEVARFSELAADVAKVWAFERSPPEAIMPEFRDVPAIAVLHLQRQP